MVKSKNNVINEHVTLDGATNGDMHFVFHHDKPNQRGGYIGSSKLNTLNLSGLSRIANKSARTFNKLNK